MHPSKTKFPSRLLDLFSNRHPGMLPIRLPGMSLGRDPGSTRRKHLDPSNNVPGERQFVFPACRLAGIQVLPNQNLGPGQKRSGATMQKLALMPFLIFGLFAVSMPTTVWAAGKGAGTSGSPFLKIPISGRAAALGGTLSSVQGDVGSLDYNPAGLNTLERADIMATYLDYLEDTSLQALLIAFPFRINGLFGSSKLSDPNAKRPVMGLEYRSFRAKDATRSDLGVKGSEFDVSDQLVAAALAIPLSDNLGLGFTGKLVSNEVASKSINTYAFDGGATYNFSKDWNMGLSVQNIGSAKPLELEADPLPLLTRLGTSYTLKSWLLLAEVSAGRDNIYRKSTGLEWAAHRLLRLRLGAYHDTSTQFSGGIGLRLGGPQKSQPLYRKSPLDPENAAADISLGNKIAEKLAQKLTAKTKANMVSRQSPLLLILPLNGGTEKVAKRIQELITNNMYKVKHYQIVDKAALNRIMELQNIKPGSIDTSTAFSLGELLDADLVLSGRIDSTDEKHSINIKLHDVKNDIGIATELAEIAVEDLAPKQKATLSSAQKSLDNQRREMDSIPNVDLGIDYGISTNGDFGITHTISLRLFY